MPTNPEEEELKRQREIRHLPYSEVSYLVSEILAFLQQKIEGMEKQIGYNLAAGNIDEDDEIGHRKALSDVPALFKKDI